MKSGVSLYCKGSKRKWRKLVWDIGMEVTEGKKLITLHFYKYLSKEVFKSDKKEHIFAHLFLVIDW